MKTMEAERFKSVWSATPTPLTADGELDIESIPRLVEHHIKLGVKGLFLAGTCGEGPWLPNSVIDKFVSEVSKANAGRMLLAVQVTDNSAARILDNIERIKDLGADIAVVAPPYFQVKYSQDFLYDMYMEIIEGSLLPVGIYHRGKNSSVILEGDTLAKLLMNEKVVLVKDSSCDSDDMQKILTARDQRKVPFYALNGFEFDCVSYLKAGYDGLLLGGGSFNGKMACDILTACNDGDFEKAEKIQESMNELMYETFGGKDFSCWLAGQKQMMVELGVFSSPKVVIDFALREDCGKAIQQAVIDYKEDLLPWC